MTTPRIAVYSGTFDPITLGHMDVIRRAAGLFDRLIVAVAKAHHKNTLFTPDERLALVRQSMDDLPNVSAESFDGLIVDFCRRVDAVAIVRGIRNGSDVDYESQMAQMNRKMAPHIETVFMLPAPNVECISSTLVREIHKLGGDVEQLVSPAVLATLQGNRG